MPSPSSSGATTTVPLSGVYLTDGDVSGFKWGSGGAGTGASVTYSFPDFANGATFSTGYASDGWDEPSGGFSLTGAQQTQFTAALQAWANVADLTFTQVADGTGSVGDIRASFTVNISQSAYAWAYYPTGSPFGGDVWLNAYYDGINSYADLVHSTFLPGSYDFMTMVHELGHGLGLSHSFGTTHALNSADDSLFTTVMSYTSIAGHTGASGLYFDPTTPMSGDIAAIQYLYGPNMAYNSGGTNYVFNEGSQYLQTIWDGGGNDTITYNSASNGGYIDLMPGHWSNLGQDVQGWYTNDGGATYQFPTFGNDVQIYSSVTIENAVGGAGADTIVGNDVANILVGGAGSDSILGGLGNDTMNGNTGFDYLDGGAGNDWVAGGQGNDTVYGGDGDDTVKGDIAVDIVDGQNGNDTVFGGQGNDALFGGAGNDFLSGDNGSDSVDGGSGLDTLTGGNGNDTLTGGTEADVFSFNQAGAGTADTVMDFVAGTDHVALVSSAFASLLGQGTGAGGTIAAGDFVSGAGLTGGLDGNDFVVYDTTSGNLYYDADGSGAGAAQLIDTFFNHAAISATDILII